jgi:hypothetical protein
LPEDVRVFRVPSVTLPIERLEFVAWRTYRFAQGIARRPASPGGLSASMTPSNSSSPPADWVDRAAVQFRLYRPREYLRAYWAWLEYARYRAWARRAAAAAQLIIQGGAHLAVVTSGPPHATHEAGRALAKRTGLPFVMDMRDPWSLSERVHESVASPLWFHLARRYERAAVEQAALIVANTEAAREALMAAYPDARHRLITAMNGSDEDPLPPSQPAPRFTVAYAGTIYLARHPRSLFRAAAQVIRELDLSPQTFGIEFLGGDAPGPWSLLDMAAQEGIAAFVSAGPARPHREALEFLARATMLVTFPGWDSITVPAKIFECVRFDAWLLALADPGSATERLLRDTEADVVAPDDTAAVAAAIRRRYQEHRRGVCPVRAVADDRFSRHRQAQVLLDAIAGIAPR